MAYLVWEEGEAEKNEEDFETYGSKKKASVKADRSKTTEYEDLVGRGGGGRKKGS